MTEQLTTEQMKEYVEARWRYMGVKWISTAAKERSFSLELGLRHEAGRQFLNEDRAAAWQAAYAFTLEREEQIRLAREEIALIGIEQERAAGPLFFSPLCWFMGIRARTVHLTRWSRILAHAQQRLAELRRGMKEPVK